MSSFSAVAAKAVPSKRKSRKFETGLIPGEEVVVRRVVAVDGPAVSVPTGIRTLSQSRKPPTWADLARARSLPPFLIRSF